MKKLNALEWWAVGLGAFSALICGVSLLGSIQQYQQLQQAYSSFGGFGSGMSLGQLSSSVGGPGEGALLFAALVLLGGALAAGCAAWFLYKGLPYQWHSKLTPKNLLFVGFALPLLNFALGGGAWLLGLPALAGAICLCVLERNETQTPSQGGTQ